MELIGTQPRIFQINISNGGVPKYAIQHANVTISGLVGDRQRNTEVHGGPERAVCLYSLELLLGLQEEGNPIFAGAMGENVVISGLDWKLVQPGVRLQLGDSVKIEMTRYTNPCNNLSSYFIDGDYSRVSQSQFPSWSRLYARVLTTGSIRAGDWVKVVV